MFKCDNCGKQLAKNYAHCPYCMPNGQNLFATGLDREKASRKAYRLKKKGVNTKNISREMGISLNTAKELILEAVNLGHK